MTSRMSYKSPFGSTGNPFNMFFVSLLFHLIALAALIITLPSASRQLTFGAPYSVALVGPEVMQSSPETSRQKDIPQPSPPDRTVTLKRKPTASEKVPLVKKTDKDRADIEKAINAIRRKEMASVRAAAKQSEAASSSGVITSYGDNQSQINDYYRFLWLKIKSNWTLPAALMPKSDVETIIEVRIARSGALEYIGFEKRSGNSGFDDAALRAVKKSAPFPPLTDWMTNRSIEIGIRFPSAELQ